MPVRAVTTRFMYKGLCTIPDVLSYRTPVNLPEDEVEGESHSCEFAFGWIVILKLVLLLRLVVASERDVQLVNQFRTLERSCRCALLLPDS